MSLTVRDFDDVYLKADATFKEWLATFMQSTFEPVALDALAQQIRQLPDPVQAQLKKRAPQEWARLFGDQP